MGKIKFQPHLTLRVISIGVIAVVLVAIGISLMTRSKRQVQVPEIDAELEEQKIDKKEGLEVRGMKGDKEVSIITAEKHYIGEDNLYHLEGNVRIFLPDKIEGEDVLIRGDKVVHDAEWTYFWLQGDATVELKDLIVESSVLEYDNQKNVLRTDQTIRFFSDTISGSARMCDYFLGQKKAELRQEVHLRVLPSQETTIPVEIDTDYFEYYIGKGRGKADGGVVLAHGESRATASLLELVLAANRQQIKSLYLKDRVKMFLVDEFRDISSFSDQTVFALHGDRCQMEANEILIRGYVDSPQVQRLEAEGECVFRFVSEGGSLTQIEGEKIAFDLTKEGSLKKLLVNRNAKIIEQDKEKNSSRFIEGNRAQILKDEKILFVEGKDALKARIWSQDSEIASQELSLFLESNDLVAIEDTKVIIYPKEKPQDTFGFFGQENPVFITAAEMRYSEKHKRFRFSGGIKLWQMKETIKAQEIILGAETGAVSARGRVESVLPYRPQGKDEEENVRIEASAMDYDPEKDIILYRENVVLRAKDVVLTAKTVTIVLEKESGDIGNIVARDKVVVTQKTYEGHGDEARFDVREEIITVVGNPVLVDKDKGKTEGGKLTFYMSDGRIVVENKDRERSVTVIKS
jgi:lipopolysaccharide transport protein LptA